MATTGGPALKVTLKARAESASPEEPSSKRSRGATFWSDPVSWVAQFKDLAPPPPRVQSASLARVGAAPPPAAASVPVDATTKSLKAIPADYDDGLDDVERGFRDQLAAFLKFPSRHVLYSPIFCGHALPMRKVFRKVRDLGGYRAVCDNKLWMRVCASLGHDLRGQTSASFAMRRNYERTGMLEWEQALDGTSLPDDAPGQDVPDPDAGRRFEPVEAHAEIPVGWRIRVLWKEPTGESAWYGAVVRGYEPGTGKHSIAYDDGTEETINFGEEKVEAAAADEE